MAKSKTTPAERVIERDSNHRSAIVKLINELGYKHGNWRVFEDWLALMTYSLSNSVDHTHAEERDKEYRSVAEQYEPGELEKMTQMFGELVMTLEEQDGHPTDVLGPLFHELELHNKWRGQFFTPPNVCLMMSRMLFGKRIPEIERRGYIGIAEPCCGSGAMILSAVHALRDADYNYQQQCWVEARDIDRKCVHMTYVQLALHGIPAVVIHGDTITLQEYDRYYTPAFILGGWPERLKFAVLLDSTLDALRPYESEANATPPPEPIILPPAVEYGVTKHGQYTLF